VLVDSDDGMEDITDSVGEEEVAKILEDDEEAEEDEE